LKTAGFTGGEILGELDAFDEQDTTLFKIEPEPGRKAAVNFLDFINTRRGKMALVNHAYLAANEKAAPLTLDTVDAQAVLWKLVEPLGFGPTKDEPVADAEPGGPAPGDAPYTAYGQGGTPGPNVPPPTPAVLAYGK